jgi:hypothetical protein
MRNNLISKFRTFTLCKELSRNNQIIYINSLKFLLILLILFVLPFQFSITAEDTPQGQVIKWKSINGVNSYKFELENSNGESIVSQVVEKNYYEINLPVGIYRFRVTVVNKFKKIGKVYNWQPLEVKPVAAPVVKSSPKNFNPKESGKSFLVKGEYLHVGTQVILKSPSGRTIIASKETLPDGSGIRVIIPENLEEGDYSISFKNSKGSPTEKNLSLDTSKPTETEISKGSDISANNSYTDSNQGNLGLDPKNPKSTKDSSNRTKYVVPMLWRQALVPGWGHYYADQKTKGSIYFVSALLATTYTLDQQNIFTSRRKDYESISNVYLFAALANNSSSNYDLLLQNQMQQSFNRSNDAKHNFNLGIQAFSAIYAISFIHSIISGTYLESHQAFYLNSYPEFYNNQMGTKYTASYNWKF